MINCFHIIIFIGLFCGCRSNPTEKINGVSLVGPRNPFPSSYFQPLSDINADYVAIIPYAFSRPGQPQVIYDQQWQWWGESTAGVVQTIQYARSYDLKIMLKPHVWISREGWPGEFTLSSEKDWQLWEMDYAKYILDYASLADSLKVEIFCIGTEYRIAVKERPDFWRQLIQKVKERYSGAITYAANWDNYHNISFWQDLDYVGINSYWSLSKNKTPCIEELVLAWQPVKNELASFSAKYDKPVLFTEYGYQSIDYAANGHWNLVADSLTVNMTGQSNAYQAIFEVFWTQSWFAGGFFWKWFPDHQNAGGLQDKRFTPQNKSAEKTIQQQYSKK